METDQVVVVFRALARADFPLLQRWLNTPHVYEWWGASMGIGALGGMGADAATVEQIEEKYGRGTDAGGPTHRFIIETDHRPIGLIQWCPLDEFADYAHAIGEDPTGTAGIDLFIGDPAALGRGLGSRAIDQFVTSIIFAAVGIKRAVTGPATVNTRSTRAFEKAGFQRRRQVSVPGEPHPEAVMVREKMQPTTAP